MALGVSNVGTGIKKGNRNGTNLEKMCDAIDDPAIDTRLAGLSAGILIPEPVISNRVLYIYMLLLILNFNNVRLIYGTLVAQLSRKTTNC